MPATEISEVPTEWFRPSTQRPVSWLASSPENRTSLPNTKKCCGKRPKSKSLVSTFATESSEVPAAVPLVTHRLTRSLASKELNNTLSPKTVKSSGSKLDPWDTSSEVP